MTEKPTKRKFSLDDSFFDQILGWGLVSIVMVTICFISLYYYRAVAPLDPDALARSIMLRLPMMALGIVMLLGSLVAAALIIPGDGLDMVGQEPIPYAIVMSALVIGVALICAYA